MFNKKIKKLIRDPKLFFSDMLLKQKKKITKIQPKEYNGNYQYTVVSAVYNVGRYLDDYFESIINQRLDFKKHIHLILVDDGSTDNSAEIINIWQKKYPDNISYIYKQNGGQASARNVGLEKANTEWVTFIDPDDFLDYEYFYSIDKFAKSNDNKELEFISCNFIFYFDEINTYKDGHPLKYRFSKGNKIYPLTAMEKQVQLSVNSAIFRLSSIVKNNISFDIRIKPNYEDAHFVTNFISSVNSGYCAFLSSAKYYYRKRGDGSSTLDNSWQHPGLYSSVLEHGCLNILQKYNVNEVKVPKTIQITVLYHLIWTVKNIINNPQKIEFLSDEQKDNFISLLNRIFEYIDADTVLDFSLAGCWFYHKVGMLSIFKKIDPDYQIVYVESFDPVKSLIELRYFSGKDEVEHITLNGVDTIPVFAKTMSHGFINQEFVKERRVWVPIKDNCNFNIKISDIKTILTVAGKQHKKGINTKDIIKNISQQIPKYDVSAEYINSWLFMDRDVQADDNAEHLYDYVKNNHPERNIYFALTAGSHDWQRLENRGFNLVEFGSDKHLDIVKSCSKIISSHVDKYVTNLLGPKMLTGRHFVFLQHGVIHNDLSDWLNQKDSIDVLVTSSPAEYEAISGNSSRYKFTEKNVKLTGLPRHDKLWSNANSEERAILIMPTWRANIVGKVKENSNSRELSSEFMDTTYAKHWYNVLHSEVLKHFSKKYNIKVIFFPHANINPYIEMFSVPEYIEVYDHKNISIQELFIKSSLMITDYSSVAFDMAVINKQTLYYQFDREEFFNGGHHFKKGYYDHRNDGFGPVVENEKHLFEKLEEILKNDCIPNKIIQGRIDKTFTQRDGQNCSRTYQAICELDQPLEEDYLSVDILIDYADRAYVNDSWELVAARYELISQLDQDLQPEYTMIRMVEAYRELGKYNIANDYIKKLAALNFYDSLSSYNIEKAKLFMACQQWTLSIHHWNKSNLDDSVNQVYYMQCLSETGQLDLLNNFIDAHYSYRGCNPKLLIDIYSNLAIHNWPKVIEIISSSIENLSYEESIVLKPNLILAKCFREEGNTEDSLIHLKKHNSKIKNDVYSIFESAKLAYGSELWPKVISCFDSIDIKTNLLSSDLALIYVKSLRHTNKSLKALSTIEDYCNFTTENDDFLIEKGENYLLEKQWNAAAEIWLELLNVCSFAHYRLAIAYRMLGMVEEGLSLLLTEGIRAPKNLDEWILRAELSQIAGNWKEANYCWSSILRYYPESSPPESWARLQHAQLMNNIHTINRFTSSI
ncbi:CDP-glycerol glycerophosphotransferase family protein [Rouxiella sp. T17]|uniref:CDP-glycerol glycerophosphotransferase family protein n=1 Tax=Rouxiella sp. T17 TaxID=3085684 RepID=UPI002FCBC308